MNRHLFFYSQHGICELTKTSDQGFPVHPASTKRHFGGFIVYWIRRVPDSLNFSGNSYSPLYFSTMSLDAEQLRNLPRQGYLVNNRVYKGISHCVVGCRKLCLFPDLMFCQGSYHQMRQSRCCKNYVVDSNGEETGQGNENIVRLAKKMHVELVERKLV